MARRWLAFILLAVALLFGREALAQKRLDPKDVPEPLKPWTGWALRDRAEALCPTLLGDVSVPRCAWPSRLTLRLDEKGGTFTQRVRVDAERLVPLPGDAKRWPLDVRVGAGRAVVVARGDVPGVQLPPGDHTLTGALAWDSMPESIAIPPETGLLDLVVRGVAVEQPNRDARGVVWLQKNAEAQEGEKLEILVHRRVTDEVPLVLTTRVVLSVAGKNREVLLGKALPAGFVPMALDAQLPARLEPDGRLRVQARPGTWTIDLAARSEGPVTELRRPKPEGPWREGEEVWVFDARSMLRVVEIAGVTAIDPQQTTLPDEWKRLPAYSLKLDDAMRFVEKRRGDADPAPDQLTLARTLWLDFDGAGYTATDVVTGTLRRSTRLDVAPPTRLGRVAIGGKDQFITRLGGSPMSGVEVRQGALSVTADSRIEGSAWDIPAVGWNHDFHQVSGTLNLPPGWRLVHAMGVDEVPTTWLKHWTLLEVFLVLVLALAAWRLWGVRWGVVALATYTLTFPEAGAPKWIWIVVLAGEAIARVLPEGKIKKAIAGARLAICALLAVITVPFLVEHVRGGIYPALAGEAAPSDFGGLLRDGMAPATTGETEEQTVDRGAVDVPRAPAPPPPPPPPPMGGAASATTAPEPRGKDQDLRKANDDEKEAAPDDARRPAPREQLAQNKQAEGKKGAISAWSTSTSPTAYRQFNAEVYDPNAMVQTGPGLPRWRWTQVSLRWSGPVDKGQRLRLVMLSPLENLAFALLRAIALAALVLRAVPWRRPGPPAPGRDAHAATTAVAVTLGLVAAWPSAVARADVPPQAVLDELRDRLLAKPECSPSCASSARLLLEARPRSLRVRMEVDAAAAQAVPLPGSATQWVPGEVQLDGQPAKALLRTPDGNLWLAVGPGSHQVTLDGAMPERETFQLPLPLKPHRVEVVADGWTIDGVHEDGLADDNLQLTRKAGAGAGAALQPGTLPPFVRVERTLLVGLNWQVSTRVVRATPLGAAVVVEVPLLKGESVTTADVRVVGGKALVNMGAQQAEASWRGVLEEKSPIVLTAPKGVAWTEVWRLDMSPVWHASLAGIPRMHGDQAASTPEWRPWPGEVATVEVTRPDGVGGQTLTIDETRYDVRPGLRATDATLTVSMRSSRGGQHTFELPPDAQLEGVTINSASQPIRQEGRKVTLPLVPGRQSATLTWRIPQGAGAVFVAPPVGLGAPSVNATTSVQVTDARWVLFLRGPRLGPVVLFWSVLLVLLVVAFALGRIAWSPLKSWQWMLLAVGLSQIPVVAAALVVGWLLFLGWRRRDAGERLHAAVFNLRQVALVLATLVGLVVLVVAVSKGLLGSPDMQIRGNGSSEVSLRWYDDRAGAELAQPWVVSVPLLAYRGVMLAWALWLAMSVLAWLKLGWGAFSSGGAWRRTPRPPMPPIAPAPPPPPPAPPAPHGPPAAPPPSATHGPSVPPPLPPNAPAASSRPPPLPTSEGPEDE
jgi:hypothetical protein